MISVAVVLERLMVDLLEEVLGMAEGFELVD